MEVNTKGLNTLVIEINFLSLIKGSYQKPTTNILNGERLTAFSKDQKEKKDACSCHIYSTVY